jgi:flagellar motor switch protein FliG
VEREIDGPGALAAILKQADISFGEGLVKEMRLGDPELAEEIRERLYTLDDIVDADDRALQDKLRGMDDRVIALLLKGRSAPFREKILSNVTDNRRQAVEEESAWLGPVWRRDADAEGRKFLEWFRSARERGEIVMYNDGDVIR